MAAAVLDRLRRRAVHREHRVGGPVPLDVLIDNRGLQAVIAALATQVFELAVEIEDKCRVRQASTRPGCSRMETDDVEGPAADTHAERGILRVVADGGVPVM